MAPILTLHAGDAKASYREHPIEVARKALLEAADLEEASNPASSTALSMRLAARSFPRRGPITKGGERWHGSPDTSACGGEIGARSTT